MGKGNGHPRLTGEGTFTVELVAVEDRTIIPVIRAIRELTGYKLEEAKALTDAAKRGKSAVVVVSLPESEAIRARDAITMAGGQARVVDAGSPKVQTASMAPADSPSPDLLDSQIATASGEMKSALVLIRDNLVAGQAVLWVGSAKVTDMGDRSSGCVVLTDAAIWVGYVATELNSVYAVHVDLGPGTILHRLRGSDSDAHFRIEGISLQSISMSPGSFASFESEVHARTIELSRHADVSHDPGPSRSALEAMQELQQLFDVGLISESEFQAKRAEILNRI